MTLVAGELAMYATTAFDTSACRADGWPLADEPCALAWERYAHDAGERGAWPVLRDVFVQLRFPVAAGVSETAAYRQAVRTGVLPDDDVDCVRLERPDALRVCLHPTLAGRVGVVAAGTRADFETLMRALARRNEPAPIPAAVNATMIAGYNDWCRVRGLRAQWAAGRGGDDPAAWAAAFSALMPHKELYQDRFILVGPGPYSGVPAMAMELDDATWSALSSCIRLEHECAHYVTRRAFGCMRDTLHDEVLADYAGITAAAGCFRADWFLRFLGLEGYPAYRSGGRLEHYGRAQCLSPDATSALQRLVVDAATQVEAFDRLVGAERTLDRRAAALTAIASVPLMGIAAANGAAQLAEAFGRAMAA